MTTRISPRNAWAIGALVALNLFLTGGANRLALAEDGHDHEEAHGHGGHEDHGDHDDHGEGGADHDDDVIRLDTAVLEEFEITVEQAKSGELAREIRLTGEVVYNADRVAHVTPLVAGIARRVMYSVGDRVEAGEVMAVLSSRELAAARSDYLAGRARLELAIQNLSRAERLYESGAGTERAVLESRQATREAEIISGQARHVLQALGFSREQIEALPALDDRQFSLYELVAPLAGMVTRRHLTVGESVEPGSHDSPYVVADLSSVWVDLTVHQRDLVDIVPGRHVRVESNQMRVAEDGVITFISPALDEATRTATARVVLANPDGHWRPGLFVKAAVRTNAESAAIVVPKSAIVAADGGSAVFVRVDEGMRLRPVSVGRETATQVEILDGLSPGEWFVSGNVLALRAEMDRASLEHAGHAH